MKRVIAASILAVVALAWSRASYAQPAGGPRYGMAPLAGLDLSADQQRRVTELRDASDRKVFALRDAMVAKSSELQQLWAAQRPDRKAIQEKQSEMDQLRRQMQEARTEYRLAVLDLLTPAQRGKFQASGGPGFGPGWGGATGAAWGMGACGCRGIGAGPAL